MNRSRRFGNVAILAVTLVLCFAVCVICSGCGDGSNGDNDGKLRIVSSFYPMHILTMNLVDRIDGVEESSMSDPDMGCIHDHTFTTDDLKKIENADLYVENGLGLETFNSKIKKTYPEVRIVKASQNVKDYVTDGDEINGHVWTNIDDYISQVEYVSSQLQKYDPDNKSAYRKNEEKYLEKLNGLKEEYSESLGKLEGAKVLVLDETLPSFCKYVKLDEMEIRTDHEQESLSASEIKAVISDMNKNGVKAILITKGSNDKNAKAISKATGATIYRLNSCMTGKVSMDEYINDMESNFKTISTIE